MRKVEKSSACLLRDRFPAVHYSVDTTTESPTNDEERRTARWTDQPRTADDRQIVRILKMEANGGHGKGIVVLSNKEATVHN